MSLTISETARALPASLPLMPSPARWTRRTRQRGASSSVIGILAVVGVSVGVGTALMGSIGSQMETTGASIGECLRGSGSCGPATGNPSTGQMSDLGKAASSAGGEGGSSASSGGGGFLPQAIDGALRGNFIERPTWGNVAGQVALGFTPAGVLGDVRDLGAAARDIRNGKDGAWVDLALAGVGVIPGVGDAVKGAIQLRRAETAAVRAGERAAGEVAAAERGAANAAECPNGVCTNGSCFGPGTLVATPSGEKAIETIETGELVVARDPETGITSERHVMQRFITPDQEVLDLGLEDGAHLGSIEHLKVTPEHPFWRVGTGWTGAGVLELGDAVRTTSGEAHVVSMQTLAKRITVYNFEVETAHTYFVGATAAWVHNACSAQDRLNQLTPAQAEAQFKRSFESVNGRPPTPAEVKSSATGGMDPAVKQRMLDDLAPAAQKPSGQVGLDNVAEQKRLDEIAQRGSGAGNAGAVTKPVSQALPETGATLGKNGDVTLDAYDRVANAADGKVLLAEKKASLDTIESHVGALREGKAIPPVEMTAGNPPVIVKGYESYVAGQMAGKPVDVKIVPGPTTGTPTTVIPIN